MAISSEDTLFLFSNHIKSYLGALKAKQVRTPRNHWRYLEGGNRNRPTVLMVHGLTNSKTVWRSVMNHLVAADYHVIAMDLPGLHSGLETYNNQYDFIALAEALQDFVCALGLDQFNIVGHSLGANVCAVYAARYGDMIDSLCLVSALAFDIALSSPEQENRFTAFRNMLRFETAEDVEAFNQKLFYSPPKIPKTLLKYRLKELQRYESFHVRLLEHMQYSMNVLLKCLKYLPKHSMIIDGQNDSFLQDDSLLLIRRRCPWVVRKQIPECAHLPFIEKPVEVTRHYQGFLEHVIGTLTPEADLSSHPEPVL